MRRINVLLLDEADRFFREYTKKNKLANDEAINDIIIKFKKLKKKNERRNKS